MACALRGDASGLAAQLNEGVPSASQEEATGRSLLMAAAGAGALECVTLLLERGAPWNALDRSGRCAGEYAYDSGCQSCVDALVNAGVRAQLVFGALEETFVVQDSPSTYLSNTVSIGDSIVDHGGDAVMMKWETPLMEAHADVLCGRFPHQWITPRRNLDVLNVGFGSGIVDGFIQDRSDALKSHTIIEAHPQILQNMRDHGWFEKVNVLPQRWQDAPLGEYDAIFFDTYAESYADMKAFFALLPRILRPNGIFSFFNGMCPFNVFFHGVACQLVLVELDRLGLEIDFVPLKVDGIDQNTWRGIKRRYWIFDTYHLPIAKWKSSSPNPLPPPPSDDTPSDPAPLDPPTSGPP